jgi:hypothetical protein
MGYFWRGVNLLTLGEWGGTATKQNLGGYKIGGTAVQFVTTTNGYLYDGTFTPTGYKKAGAQIVLQTPGCRPRSTVRWQSGGAGTAYIHRYGNGAVYVTGTTTHTENTGDTRLSWPTDSANFPRGLRYMIVQLCGGGGGGGAAGLLVTYNNQGGQGAAGAVCIRLPEDGYATLTVGTAGSAGSGIGDAGDSGGASRVVCGGFTATAGAGGGGKGGQNSTGSGGSWSVTANNADGVTLASSNGSGGTTSAKTVSYTDYAPEGGTVTTRGGGAGGDKGRGNGYGSGGAGGVGIVDLYY